MANADAAFGFRPVQMLDGSPYNGQTILCQFRAGDSTATFIGDPVELDANEGTEPVPTVAQADPTADPAIVFGVVVAMEFDPDDLTSRHRLASTQRLCHVVPALDCLFEVQADGATGVGAIGDTADFAVGSGNTTTALSTAEITSAGIGTGLNVQILGIPNRPDNDPASDNANVLIRFNEVGLRGTGTGA
jgi:hypothetical protein